jgi:hypothetical protein
MAKGYEDKISNFPLIEGEKQGILVGDEETANLRAEGSNIEVSGWQAGCPKEN